MEYEEAFYRQEAAQTALAALTDRVSENPGAVHSFSCSHSSMSMGNRAAILAALAAAFAIGIANIVAVWKLKRYRVDIGPLESPMSGSHWSWQYNVLSPGNYTAVGKKKLRWLYVGIFLQLACLGVAIFVAGASL